MKYDYLIVGAGLFGSVFAHEAAEAGRSCLVVDRRSHPGGNLYCETIGDIVVHRYGAHIFHTSDKEVWDYVNRFVSFNRYTNSPVANFRGEIYNLPFNMNTFYRLWGCATPQEAKEIIAGQQLSSAGEPGNLEEQAIRLVGRDIYEKLVKGYTEKQWGRPCGQLPPFIIKRLPVRFTYDNNYFDDLYQGIPVEGYNALIGKLLEKAELRLDCDYLANRAELSKTARATLFTGCIDAFYGYRFGPLEYRSLRFETETLETDNFQGNAVVNYTDRETPYTRIIEHKHFLFGKQPKTIVTKEYPAPWHTGREPYYPVNNDENQALYRRYKQLAGREEGVLFGGRLAEYSYYDMDKTIASALSLCRRVLPHS